MTEEIPVVHLVFLKRKLWWCILYLTNSSDREPAIQVGTGFNYSHDVDGSGGITNSDCGAESVTAHKAKGEEKSEQISTKVEAPVFSSRWSISVCEECQGVGVMKS